MDISKQTNMKNPYFEYCTKCGLGVKGGITDGICSYCRNPSPTRQSTLPKAFPFIVLGILILCVVLFYPYTQHKEEITPLGDAASDALLQTKSYYAEIAKDGTVIRVIVASPQFIESGVVEGTWIETKDDGSIRKNPAGVGHKYESTIDAFVPPKPAVDAILDADTAKWVVPQKQIIIPEIIATTTP